MSKLNVYLSPLAESKLETLLDYLVSEWSQKSKKKFLKKLEEKINQIATQPNSCPESKEFPGLFKGVVEKHTSIFYRIHNDGIEIITIFDNRQNPSTLDKEV